MNTKQQPEALRLAKMLTAAEATEEVENLRKSLVYVAFALHATPQYMLAQGITLIDGDTVRVSRDGWTVEASVNPHRQTAPATQQVGEPRNAIDRDALIDAIAQGLPSTAYAALPEYGINTASHAHFRVLGFTADQMRAFADATHTLRAPRGLAPAETGNSVSAQTDSVLEDAARYRWLREGNDAKHGAAWHVAVNLYGCEWDAAIDAAMNKGATQ